MILTTINNPSRNSVKTPSNSLAPDYMAPDQEFLVEEPCLAERLLAPAEVEAVEEGPGRRERFVRSAIRQSLLTALVTNVITAVYDRVADAAEKSPCVQIR